MALFTLLCALSLSIGMVQGNPGGPPVSTCAKLTPLPPAPHKLQTGNGGYTINTNLSLNTSVGMYMYTAGRNYTVTVQASNGTIFRGFLVQSRNPGGSQIGTFATLNTQQQLLNCSTIPKSTTIAHNNSARQNFTSQTFNWTAPSAGNGLVNFMYTIVRVKDSYYGPLSAAAVALNRPASVTNPTRNLMSYRLNFRSPAGCVPSACTIFVGIDTNAGNSSYLDIYMEANATAWVGVGFSTTRSMFNADVVACNIASGTEVVAAVDTWNGPSPGRTNTFDAIQDVSLFSGSNNNGRLSCTMARRIAGSDVPKADLNLDGDYWVMYGWAVNRKSGGALAGHVGIPALSSTLINPSSGATIAATPLLLALLAAITILMNERH